jgi:hypothetical protein
MSAIYDDVEIEDMDFDEEKQTYYYPCPCGDKFFITLVRLLACWARMRPVCGSVVGQLVSLRWLARL